MEFAIAIFTALLFLLITEGLKPEKPSKTSEEEIGEAISKYLASMKKAKGDQNAKK
ncbi:MAG: hypothetical protein ACAF41_27095 [Leptolyngbya sp. BL-A-14]